MHCPHYERVSCCPGPLPQECLRTVLSFENAPACYRAPKWPYLEFPQRYRENTPRAKILGTLFRIKCSEDAEKNPKTGIFGFFFGISRVFWGYFLGVPEFWSKGYFLAFFLWKFWVGPSRGSVAGGGILKLSFKSIRLTQSPRPVSLTQCTAQAIFTRAAHLQNEIAPEKQLSHHAKWYEKREDGSEKQSETSPQSLSPSHVA